MDVWTEINKNGFTSPFALTQCDPAMHVHVQVSFFLWFEEYIVTPWYGNTPLIIGPYWKCALRDYLQDHCQVSVVSEMSQQVGFQSITLRDLLRLVYDN